MTATRPAKCRFCSSSAGELVTYQADGARIRAGRPVRVTVVEHAACLERYKADEARREAAHRLELDLDVLTVIEQIGPAKLAELGRLDLPLGTLTAGVYWQARNTRDLGTWVLAVKAGCRAQHIDLPGTRDDAGAALEAAIRLLRATLAEAAR